MRHAGIDLINRFGAVKAANLLSRVEGGAVSPGTLPARMPLALALVPPVAAGLLFFRLHALEILLVALIAGVAGTLAQRLLRLRTDVPLLIPPLIAVALAGAGANLLWVAGMAVAAAVLEILRAVFLPTFRIQAGVVAYVLAFVVGSSNVAAYLRPADLHPGPEPVALWLHFFPASAAPIDPIRMYVGNVAGPVFATSLLAVAVSIAWLWYTHRLRLTVLGGFLLGALLPSVVMGWNSLFQVDSGPAWFVAGLVVADAANTRHWEPVQALMGFAAGLAGVAFRSRGAGIEAMAVAAAGVQFAVGLTEGAIWAARRRRVVTSRLPGMFAAVRSVRLPKIPRRSADRQLSD